MINSTAQKLIKIHYTKKSRRIFKWSYIGLIVLILGLFVCFGYMISCGINLNGTSDFDPSYPNWTITNSYLFGFGLFFFICLLFLTGILAFYIPIVYKKSRMIYFQTEKYKKNVEFYENSDLNKFTKKELKWLFKLGYIKKVDYVTTLNNKKKMKK